MRMTRPLIETLPNKLIIPFGVAIDISAVG